MRCACTRCDTWMIHAESDQLGCVCPACGARCTACLGTNSVVSRDALASLASDPRFDPDALYAQFLPDEESDE